MAEKSNENATKKKRREKKVDPEVKFKELVAECEEKHKRWHIIYENGCYDPNYADGCNLWLVRNHISYARERIKEFCEQHGFDLPEIYHKRIPDEVPRDYMAKPDLIRSNAQKALALYESDPDYLELLEKGKDLSPKQKAKVFYPAVTGYVKYLREAIENDDLVSMRMRSRTDTYKKSFRECLDRIAKLEPESFQLSLFDMTA